MPKRFLLSERSARILAGMARQNGAGSGSSGASSDARRHLSPPVPTAPDMHLIRVDDDTPDADGYYDATLIFYNAPEETFEDLQEIKAIEPNGEPLREQYYHARRHGENPDSSPVFSVFGAATETEIGVTSVTISTNQNNYAAPSRGILNVNATGAFSFTGFSGGYAGRTFEIANTGTYDITIPHESSSSSSDNQVSTPTGGSWVIPPKTSMKLKYLGSKWYVADVPQIPSSHVSGGGSGVSASGTTTNSYVTVFNWSNAAGLWAVGELRNLDGSNSIQLRVSGENAWGETGSSEATSIGPGLSQPIGLNGPDGDVGLGLAKPLTDFHLEVKSFLSGYHASWELKLLRLA